MQPDLCPAIVAENLSKNYPRSIGGGFFRSKTGQKAALTSVSLEVQPGETVGLLGPNGAGKTTLLKIIATLLSPTSGRVLIHGWDSVQEPVLVRRSLGLVTCDERSFYWRISGRQNLAFFATLYGMPRRTAQERIPFLLEVLGLADAADRLFHTYSSGMKQKLAIARGLLSEPSIILYDEPTRSLDPLSTQNVRNWLAANRKSSPHTAHLIATNQLQEAVRLCDRVVILNRGVVIASGTIGQIQEAWRQREYAVHRLVCRGCSLNGALRASPEEGLLDIQEECRNEDRFTLRLRTIENSDALSRVMDRILLAGGTILRCETEQVSFDDIFCSLVQADQARCVAGGNA